MASTMISLLENHVHYDISKFYLAISDNYPVIDMNLRALKDVQDKVKAEAEKRYGDIKSDLPGLNIVLERINYILSRLENWISSNEIYKNKDAEIFVDGLSDRFDELEELLEELDNKN